MNSNLQSETRTALSNHKRVVVIEENPHSRSYLKEILQSTHDLSLVGDFSNVDEAVSQITALRANLVLLGVPVLNLNAVECVKRLKRLTLGLKIIIITRITGTDWVEPLLAAGADAFLFSPVSAGQCQVAMTCVLRNELQNEEKLQKTKAGVVYAPTPGRRISLSPREHDVMSGLTSGLLYKEIAAKLGISYSAVHKFQNRLFKKLRVSNRSEAIGVWHRTLVQEV